jgi:hypothetical protein
MSAVWGKLFGNRPTPANAAAASSPVFLAPPNYKALHARGAGQCQSTEPKSCVGRDVQGAGTFTREKAT